MYTIEEYCKKINIPVSDLRGRSRKHKFSTPRQIYWYYLFTNKTGTVSIGKDFDRKHSTIIHGINTIRGLIEIGDKTINPYLEVLDIF